MALTCLSLLTATFACILSPFLSIIYQYQPIKYSSNNLADLLIQYKNTTSATSN